MNLINLLFHFYSFMKGLNLYSFLKGLNFYSLKLMFYVNLRSLIKNVNIPNISLKKHTFKQN